MLALHDVSAPSEAIGRLIVDLVARIEPEPMSGCWLWTGGTTDLGYGAFEAAKLRYGVPERLVHRILWHVVRGPIPTGLKILHRCDVRPCVNVFRDLFLGTQLDNIADMVAKGRRRGNPARGERSHLARLTAEDVSVIRAAHAAGEPQRHLAARFGVAVMTINRAVRGLSWAAEGARQV